MHQFLAIVSTCVLVILVLRLATIGADSATTIDAAIGHNIDYLPNPIPSSAEECASFAQFWMDISKGGPDAVAAVSHCRRDASGAWILAQTEVSSAAATRHEQRHQGPTGRSRSRTPRGPAS